MIGAEDIVQITLPQVPIVDPGGDGERALGVGRNPELIADQRGAAGLDGVVVGHGVDGPDLVIVDKLAGHDSPGDW